MTVNVCENSNYNMEIKWYLGGNYPDKNLFMLFFFRVSSSFPSNNEFGQKLQNGSAAKKNFVDDIQTKHLFCQYLYIDSFYNNFMFVDCVMKFLVEVPLKNCPGKLFNCIIIILLVHISRNDEDINRVL